MRLRDIENGKRAIKRVPFRPAIGAAQPGRAPLEAHAEEITVGVRVLSGEETRQVYEKAREAALASGVEAWSEDDPLCRLHRMAHQIVLACVEVPDDPSEELPDDPRPFFDSVHQVMHSPIVGRDNIVYLFDRTEAWQDECGLPEHKLTPEQVIAILLQEAERPENADSPLDRMRPGLARSFLRTTAALFANLLRDKSDSGSAGDTSTPNGSETSQSEPKKRGGRKTRTRRSS